MEFLKAETIEKIISLAENCYQKKQGSIICNVWDIDMDKIFQEYLPRKSKLVNFVNSLNDNEKAELLALMRLGRDDSDNWVKLLEDAKSNLAMVGNYIGQMHSLLHILEKGLISWQRNN